MNIILKPTDGNKTSQIQKAFDDCFLSGGGEVRLTKGLYTVGGLRLRSNTTLYLESGAILKGTRNPEDYKILDKDIIEPVKEEYKTDVLWNYAAVRTTHDHFLKPGSSWNNAVIRILDAKNVSIIGEEGSVIDGSDCYDEKGEEFYRGPHGISIHNSQNLSFSGYTIQHTGNWFHQAKDCENLCFTDITALGGHDGVHLSSCDNIKIIGCKFYTGDDCVAGFDNNNVLVRGCELNSACSGLRFGGNKVLVENCHFFGPAKYMFRGSLSLEGKIAGNPSPTEGRKTMLSLFTYYSDFTLKVRNDPKNIIIRNCKAENVERFLHYDFTGKQVWQKNRPLREITFEGIEAENILMPLNAYGDPVETVDVSIKNSSISFVKEADCVIRGGNFGKIEIDSVEIKNLSAPLVKVYGEVGEIKVKDLIGVKDIYTVTDEEFEADPI
jgi:hypothetical protein